MTVPLGNTPAPANTPDELKSDALVWMGNATKRGEAPVIVFYRTLEHGQPFAPKAENIDPQTGQPRLVHPVTVDLFFPNGPLAGRVYRRVGFINAGITGPIRTTAIGSISVGQLATEKSRQGNPYAQLNSLDPDALAWATQIHQAAGGDVFAHYGGGPSAPVTAPAQAQPPADRFAGMAVPTPGQQAAQPATVPAGPPASLGAMAPAAANGGQPQPVASQPPAGVPALGAPPAGPPAGLAGVGAGAAPGALAGIGEPPY